MSEDKLPGLQVDVHEAGGRARAGRISCEIDTNLIFKTHNLAAYFFSKWDPAVFDLMLLAASVEFCDRIQRRPALGWGRAFELRLPVHDPHVWNRKSVSEALHEALELLTGDQWKITFVKRKTPADEPAQQLFHLDMGAEAVIPFSDGLDSRAVGALMAEEYGGRLIRVRLGSKKKDQPKDPSGRRQPFMTLPYKVKPGASRFVESSARSRGFKFAVLSGSAAYFAKAGKVIVPESGQGAIGPTLVPVGQAYEDYRNHPRFMKHMTAFFKALLGSDIAFVFPRLWFTKGETLKEYMALSSGKDTEWLKTRSCWQDNRHVSVNNQRRQCGICAACMLRRLSVYAANLTEPADMYVWENLSAPTFDEGVAEGFDKRTRAQRQYAIAGTLHLDHLAYLKRSRAAERSLDLAAFQLARSLDESEAVIRPKLDRLLSQHQKEWKSYMTSLGPQSFVAQWADNDQCA
ncbi:7-cyano-7-deazaguanine synthase [Bradyrhizobium liaoningense]|uniref:7-cyano-7-deazaguanine synthase n=1 Tax=Bradyrhizobium liaoningense TaxID=43992 RepID=UPI001BA66820|nr:7-cyano-7-deazaguanine synthase [Bradyrhizobium liaoningense]MBR0818895.1 7-cyano-7-deazaguanine synthase [Bradyrhizobium liaoningense]